MNSRNSQERVIFTISSFQTTKFHTCHVCFVRRLYTRDVSTYFILHFIAFFN